MSANPQITQFPQPQSASWAKAALEKAQADYIEAVIQKPNTPYVEMLRQIFEARKEYALSFIAWSK